MEEFKYRASVIIPVYNTERFLKEAVDSLQKQTIPQEDLEIILIDDGSQDGSPALCDRLAQEYPNIVVLHQKNSGVSAARNVGIANARGKYLFYLDSDDTLSPETVQNVCDFFDLHYDEVDLVTYPLTYHYEDGKIQGHPRYKILNHTGIYDLRNTSNAQVALALVNICTKNKYSPTLFSRDLKMSVGICQRCRI